MGKNKPNAWELHLQYQQQEYYKNKRNYCTEISDPKASPCRKLSSCLAKNRLEYKTNKLCYQS